MSSVRVRVVESEIVVVDQRSEWRASYRHSPALRNLIATEIVTDAKATALERAEFLGQAFGKACERARKLGWIV